MAANRGTKNGDRWRRYRVKRGGDKREGFTGDDILYSAIVLGPIVAGQDHWGHLSMRVGVPGEDSWRRSTASPASDVRVNNSFSQSFRFGSQTLIQIQGLVVLVEESPITGPDQTQKPADRVTIHDLTVCERDPSTRPVLCSCI